MKEINYQSDFKARLILRNANGEDIGFPPFDFRAVFSTGGVRTYTISSIGGVLTNCLNEDNTVVAVFDNHHLGVGTLTAKFIALLPNGDYPDLSQRVVTMDSDTAIALVYGNAELPSDIEIEAVIPYIQGKDFTFEDFTAEQLQAITDSVANAAKEQVQGVANELTAADKERSEAEEKRVQAESLRQESEAARAQVETNRVQAEQNRVKAESSRSEAENERSEAENERSLSEQSRADAESARANAEKERVQAESSRVAAEEDRAAAALLGAINVDFGAEAVSASIFNTQGCDIEITEVKSINVATLSLTAEDGEPSEEVVGRTLSDGGVCVISITRQSDAVEAAAAILFKRLK